MQRKNAYTPLTIALALLLVSCGHSQRTVIPEAGPNSGKTASSSRISEVQPLFEKARGKLLKDSDYDAYIDASVVGEDRKLARALLRFEPADARGDFVYFDPKTQHVLSNNPEIVKHFIVHKTVFLAAAAIRSQQNKSSSSNARHIESRFNNQCTPPQPYPGGGPYFRMVSKCTFAGGLGLVKIPCNASYMAPGDHGFVYFELSNGTGAGSHDLVEGGLEYDTDTFDGTAQSGIYPYYRSTFQRQYNNLNEVGFHYSCGTPIMIAHGMVNRAAGVPQNLTYTFTGQIDSNFNPAFYWNGVVYNTWQHPFFKFNPAPDSMNHPGTDLVGKPTPCMGCSIGRVTAIGQSYEGDTGSYFGDTTFGQDINWEQVEFGQWQQGCAPGAIYCYFLASKNYQNYYGGEEQWNASSVIQVSGPTQTGYGPWQTQEAIATFSSRFAGSAVRPAESFSSATLPSCQPDTAGYCFAWSGPQNNIQAYGVDAYGFQCAYNPEPLYSQDYWVQQPMDVLQRFTKTLVDDGTGSCSETANWSPYDPHSDDPTLP